MDAYKEIIKPEIPIVKYFISDTNNGREIAAHPHWHDAIEILYVVKGLAKQQIDGNIFEVSKDDIVVIWHDQIHSTYSIQGVECEMAVLQIFMDDIHYLDKSIRFLSEIKKVNPVYSDILNILKIVPDELYNKKNGFFHIIKAEINKFYGQILRNSNTLPLRTDNFYHKKDVILKIFEYIDNNYFDYRVTLESAAKHIHLSVPQFMRIFKAATGMTFKYYLNLYRIKKSFSLLSENETVTKISEMCGFLNINTYIRLFKLHTGITPTQYTKNIHA